MIFTASKESKVTMADLGIFHSENVVERSFKAIRIEPLG